MGWTIQPLHKVWLIPDTSISELFKRYMVWTISVLLKSIFSGTTRPSTYSIVQYIMTASSTVLSLILCFETVNHYKKWD
jgi:hypothetical protein